MSVEKKKTNQWRVGVRCFGIKKKCRKAERHYFPMGYRALDCNQETLKENALQFLMENMRDFESPEIHLAYVTLTDHGDYQSETWEPFAGKDKKIVLGVDLVS